MASVQPAFKQVPMAMPGRLGLAAWMYGVMTPVVRGLEAVGRADRMFMAMTERQRRNYEKTNPFGNYAATRNDVFVAVYIKSGTNWTMQIVHQLLFHGDAEFDHIHCVVPWPDAPPFLGKYAIPLEDASVRLASPEGKRVIKSHLDWGKLPYSDEARYILVVRDPKDVFVSSYFFLREVFLGPAMPSIDTWFKVWLSSSTPFGGWAEHTASYWAQRHRPNVLLLSFKSMKQDLRGVVGGIAKFLELQASDEIIERVCERSSFDYMKRIDQKFAPYPVIPGRGKVTMMRKGAQGGSSELLTRDQQRQLDAHFMSELKRVGSDFPYAEFCDLA